MAIKTTFWEDSPFGKLLDEDITKYSKSLDEASAQIQEAQKAEWAEKSKLTWETQEQIRKDTAASQEEIDRISDEFKTSTAQRRQQAEDLVRTQEEAAWLEANIAAAKAWAGWRLSVSQLSSINKDITNQFATSINNAQKDNINFQIWLDDKLQQFWLSIVDKKKILDEFTKSLDDAETAPLLDAIASQSATKIDFIKNLSDTIKEINKWRIEQTEERWARDRRIAIDEQAFNEMTWAERASNVRDRFGASWNVLSPWQRNKIINDAALWKISLSETLDLIKNTKDQAEQQKLISQQSAAWSELWAQEALLEAWKQTTSTATFTTWQAPAWEEEEIRPRWDVSYEDPQSNVTAPTGYVRGWITYVSKAAYDTVLKNKDRLATLKERDPEWYKKAIELIKDKYILK